MAKITQLTLVADFTPEPDPPEANAVFTLGDTYYSVNELETLHFIVNRTIRTDQVLDVDWAFINVSMLPVSGTLRFNVGASTASHGIQALEVDTNELGSLVLSNPRYVSGPVSNPILGTPFQAVVNLFDLDEEEASPTIIVRADGSGDFTTIEAAMVAAAPADIIEVQANTPGTTQYFEEPSNAMNWASGTNGNEITLRGRASDTIVIWANGDIIWDFQVTGIAGAGITCWEFQDLQYGRDETLNGWSFATNRINVEHNSCIWTEGATSVNHHLIWRRCRFYGGFFYDGCIHQSVIQHHWAFIDCEPSHCGNNGSENEVPNPNGNNIVLRGPHSVVIGGLFRYGGHDNLHIESPYQVVRNALCDGDWSAYNPGTGNRAFTGEASKGTAPYGPVLIENNVMRYAYMDGNDEQQSGGKHMGFNMIMRYNVVYENDGPQSSYSALRAAGVTTIDGLQHYKNTCYASRFWLNSTDINLGAHPNGTPLWTGTHDGGAGTNVLVDNSQNWTGDDLVGRVIRNGVTAANGLVTAYTQTTVTCSGVTFNNGDSYQLGGPADDHYNDIYIRNNIASHLGDGDKLTGRHVTCSRSFTRRAAAYNNDWRGGIIDYNILHSASVTYPQFIVRLSRSGGGLTLRVGITSIQAQWPDNWQNNDEVEPTYTGALANRGSFDFTTAYNSFALDAGSPVGVGDAHHLTETTNAGVSSTALIVDRARVFYDGENPATWDLAYFGETNDWIKIGSSAPVQIESVDSDTGMTLRSARTWGNGDFVWHCPDGVNPALNRGAIQT